MCHEPSKHSEKQNRLADALAELEKAKHNIVVDRQKERLGTHWSEMLDTLKETFKGEVAVCTKTVVSLTDELMEKHKKLVEALKVGDRVITNGGMFGTITSLEERTVVVEIAKGTKVSMLKSYVGGLATEDTEKEMARGPAM